MSASRTATDLPPSPPGNPGGEGRGEGGYRIPCNGVAPVAASLPLTPDPSSPEYRWRGEARVKKSIAIVQSNYIPWKGYFDMIRGVDAFILYDDVQYTRRDWRNRNRIKTAHGTQWLTIPVDVKGKYLQKIKDTKVSDPNWARTHWQTLSGAYGKAPFFRELKDRFEAFYLGGPSEFLSDINRDLIAIVCDAFGIETAIRPSMDYELTQDDPTARLLEICLKAGATEYVSGPAAKEYFDVGLFERAGVAVRWMEYAGYPEYPQMHGPFEHAVTALDLLFAMGPDAARCLDRLPQ